MSGPFPYGRPTAAELVAAVAEFLDGDVRSATSGAVNFHALVAANALRIVERELRDTTAAEACDALSGLGYPDEASFAADIRSGRLDSNTTAVTESLRTIVGHRLAVSHPGYSAG